MDDLVLDEGGNILISDPVSGPDRQKAGSHQLIDGNRVPLASSFAITRSKAGEYLCGISVGDNYSPDYTLVIDPSVGFRGLPGFPGFPGFPLPARKSQEALP